VLGKLEDYEGAFFSFASPNLLSTLFLLAMRGLTSPPMKGCFSLGLARTGC
jgi:hypothetical protein